MAGIKAIDFDWDSLPDTIRPIPNGTYPETAMYSEAVNIGKSTQALKDKAVAIGSGATAKVSEGDVALGSGSVTAAPVATANYTIHGTTYNFAGTTHNQRLVWEA